MVIKFLRLIRIQNLFMMAMTLLLVRYCLIMPAFLTEKVVTSEMPSHLSKILFLLLVGSTLLIAAGGYIINDIQDVDIDTINKPGKNLINNGISEALAMKCYYAFTAFGLLSGTIVAFKIGKFSMASIPLFCALSLYMYSTFYKKRLIIGNLIIAILSSISVLIVGLFEPEFYRNITYLLYYGIFAFEVSLIREIIKDAEDLDGDERAQCKTIPIRFGLKATKIIVSTLIILTMASILFVLYFDFRQNTVISFYNLCGLFFLPLIALIYLVVTAENKSDFHYASLFTKAYMLLGIFSIAGLWFYFLK